MFVDSDFRLKSASIFLNAIDSPSHVDPDASPSIALRRSASCRDMMSRAAHSTDTEIDVARCKSASQPVAATATNKRLPVCSDTTRNRKANRYQKHEHQYPRALNHDQRSHSVVSLALYPLSLLAFLVLHLAFWIIYRTRHVLQSKLVQSRAPTCPAQAPQHIAIAIAARPASTWRSLYSLVSSWTGWHQRPSDTTNVLEHTTSEIALVRQLLYRSAALGATQVSLWTENPCLVSGILKAADREGYLKVTGDSDQQSSYSIDVRPVKRARDQSVKSTDALDIARLNCTRPDPIKSAQRCLSLHIMTPDSHGPSSFAHIASELAKQMAGDKADSTIVVTPATVDHHLRSAPASLPSTFALPSKEPDLLIVVGGHWLSRNGLAGYPRWDLRLADIHHSSHGIRSHSTGIEVKADQIFTDALVQYARAEQRFGR